MTAVATVIAALLIVLAAALWLELRAERQAAARVLASYLRDTAREGPCRCGEWLAECPVHTADFWRGQLDREPTS